MNITAGVVDNFPFICSFCVKSSLYFISNLNTEISQLKDHIVSLEKTCMCKSLSLASLSLTPSSTNSQISLPPNAPPFTGSSLFPASSFICSVVNVLLRSTLLFLLLQLLLSHLHSLPLSLTSSYCLLLHFHLFFNLILL